MIRTRNKQPRLPGFCKQTEHYKGLYYKKKKKIDRDLKFHERRDAIDNW